MSDRTLTVADMQGVEIRGQYAGRNPMHSIRLTLTNGCPFDIELMDAFFGTFQGGFSIEAKNASGTKRLYPLVPLVDPPMDVVVVPAGCRLERTMTLDFERDEFQRLLEESDVTIEWRYIFIPTNAAAALEFRGRFVIPQEV